MVLKGEMMFNGEMVGAGAVSVAAVVTAWSHPGRVRSGAAFASLAGVNPGLKW